MQNELKSSFWFYLDEENKTQGRVSVDDLKDLFDEQIITAQTLVYRQTTETNNAWKKVEDIPELLAYFKSDVAEENIDDLLGQFESEITELETTTETNTASSEASSASEAKPSESTTTNAVPENNESANANSAQQPQQPNTSAQYPYRFDPERNTYVYTDTEAGVDMEYDVERKAWIPIISESVLSEQQKAYSSASSEQSAADPTTAQAMPPTTASAIESGKKKRKRTKEEAAGADNDGQQDAKKQKTQAEKVTSFTGVYVTGIPKDVTIEEFKECFKRCGVIKDDPTTGEEKAKLYTDKQTGEFLGAGLIVYAKKESVDLALQYLNNYEIRPGAPIQVQRAEFQNKKPDGEAGSGAAAKSSTAAEKRRKKKKQSKSSKKLAWGFVDDRDSRRGAFRQDEPTKMIVILKKMFVLDDFLTDPSFGSDLKEDLMSECGKFGHVEKVKIFSDNPEGVVSIRFKTPDDAQRCIQALNGRFYSGRQISAETYDGVTDYDVKESNEDVEKRFEKFSEEMQADEEQE